MNSNASNNPHIAPEVMTDEETDLQEPVFYHVILLNDDYTPMDFVIEVLMHFFQKNQKDAYQIMLQVHEQERGIAGTYSREIAEEKMNQVIQTAQANEFPLSCVIEAE